MTPFAALALYPLWAVAMTVLITVLRLGRDTRRGLLALCFFLALWVTGLILLESPLTAAVAERVVPSGHPARRGLPSRRHGPHRRREPSRRRRRVRRSRPRSRCSVSPIRVRSTVPVPTLPVRSSCPSRSCPRSPSSALVLWLARAALAGDAAPSGGAAAPSRWGASSGRSAAEASSGFACTASATCGSRRPFLLVVDPPRVVRGPERRARALARASSCKGSPTRCSRRRSRRSVSPSSSGCYPTSRPTAVAASSGRCWSSSSRRCRWIRCASWSSRTPAGACSRIPSACATSPIRSSAPRSAPIRPSASPRSAGSRAPSRTRSGTRSASSPPRPSCSSGRARSPRRWPRCAGRSTARAASSTICSATASRDRSS